MHPYVSSSLAVNCEPPYCHSQSQNYFSKGSYLIQAWLVNHEVSQP